MPDVIVICGSCLVDDERRGMPPPPRRAGASDLACRYCGTDETPARVRT